MSGDHNLRIDAPVVSNILLMFAGVFRIVSARNITPPLPDYRKQHVDRLVRIRSDRSVSVVFFPPDSFLNRRIIETDAVSSI